MKPKHVAILAMVTAVLIGLVLLKERQDKPADIVVEANLTPLVPQGLTAEDITKIEFYKGDAPDKKIVLTRAEDGTGWTAPSQFNAPLNKEKIDAFLEKMASLKGEIRPFTQGSEDLESYELTEPKSFSVVLYRKGEDKPAAHVLVGKAADAQTVFVRRDDSSEIYQTDVNLRTEAGLNPAEEGAEFTADSWIERQLLKLEPNSITHVAMTMPDKQLVLERKEKPAEAPKPADPAAKPEEPKPEPAFEWAVAEGAPDGKAIKESVMPAFLRGLESVYATSVVDPAKAADYGLDKPVFRAALRILGQEGETIIEGGRPDPTSDNAYLRVAGKPGNVIYQVTTASFENVFPKGDKLFSLAQMEAKPADVNRVELVQPEGNAVLVRENGAWKVESPQATFNAQSNTIDTIASTLSQWKAEDYAQSPDGRGLETPQRQVTFTTAPDQTHTIALGNPSLSTAGNYARLDANPTALVMAKNTIERIFVAPKDLYERTLLSGTSQGIKRIAETYGEASFEVVRPEGSPQWNLTVNGATQPAMQPAIENLAATLSGVQASDILFDKTQLDAAPVATIQFTKEGIEHTLSIGPEQNGSHQATLTGKDKVFVLLSEDVRTLLVKPESLIITRPEGAPDAPTMPGVEGLPPGVSIPMMPPSLDMPAPPSAPEAAPVVMAPEAAPPAPAPEAAPPAEAPAAPQPAEAPAAPAPGS